MPVPEMDELIRFRVSGPKSHFFIPEIYSTGTEWAGGEGGGGGVIGGERGPGMR